MSLMTIVVEGDPRLRQRAAKIRNIDNRLRSIAEEMRETMLDAPGVGLAGPQVGVMERIIVVHVPGDYISDDAEDVDYTLINPEIVRAVGNESATEGCLSIPGWVARMCPGIRRSLSGRWISKGTRFASKQSTGSPVYFSMRSITSTAFSFSIAWSIARRFAHPTMPIRKNRWRWSPGMSQSARLIRGQRKVGCSA